MSNKGYSFESEIEDIFLKLEGKTKQDPIIDGAGKILRTFRVPSSGMMASFPGDVITANPKFDKQIMIECKARYSITKKHGQVFRLNMDWIIKNEKEAYKEGYIPLFALCFKKAKIGRIWFVINKEDTFKLFGNNINFTPLPFKKKGKIISLIKEKLNKSIIYYFDNYYLFSIEKFLEKIKNNLCKKGGGNEK